MSHHLFILSLPPHDICTRVSELVIGYTMSETHTYTPVVHMYVYTYELMYALPGAFLQTGLANDVGGVENHIALAITVPCVPPLAFTSLCLVLFYSMIAHRPIGAAA